MQSARSLTQRAKSPREESAGHGVGVRVGVTSRAYEASYELMNVLWNETGGICTTLDYNKNHLPVTSLWWAAWHGSHISTQEQTRHHTAQHCRPHMTDSVTSCTPINNHLELPQRHRVPFHNSCCLSSLSRYETVSFLTSCDPLHIDTISNSEWLPASFPKFCKKVLVCMIYILYPTCWCENKVSYCIENAYSVT